MVGVYEMSSRAEITQKLSKLVEKRLNSNHMYWSSEVNFDKGMQNERRIDFVGFKPFTPDIITDANSVELGTFECYEVKSCMADFKSGNGLTFYGDKNYLVTTKELDQELYETNLIPWDIDAILIPDKNWTHLYSHRKSKGTHRQRISSEFLWEIVKAHK